MNANEAFQFLRKGGILPKQPVSKSSLLDQAKRDLEEIGCTVSVGTTLLNGWILAESEGDLEDRSSQIGSILSQLGEGCLWDEEEGESLWRIDFYGGVHQG